MACAISGLPFQENTRSRKCTGRPNFIETSGIIREFGARGVFVLPRGKRSRKEGTPWVKHKDPVSLTAHRKENSSSKAPGKQEDGSGGEGGGTPNKKRHKLRAGAASSANGIVSKQGVALPGLCDSPSSSRTHSRVTDQEARGTDGASKHNDLSRHLGLRKRSFRLALDVPSSKVGFPRGIQSAFLLIGFQSRQ